MQSVTDFLEVNRRSTKQSVTRCLERSSRVGLLRRLSKRCLSGWCTLRVMLLLVATGPAIADTLAGLVVGVHDGDTVTVLDSAKVQHKVRLAGIDAPELGQPWGQRFKQGLSAAVYLKQVDIEWYKRDHYGRLVGKVQTDGHDVNLLQVSSGLAWHYVEYAKEQVPEDRQLYASAEATARRDGVGLWRDQMPTPPWDYRRSRRANNSYD